jgi:hypothetical protein
VTINPTVLQEGPLGHGRGSRTRQRHAIVGAIALLASLAAGSPAAAQFSVSGKKVAPVETNFAGARQVTPRYGLVVQINHDVQPPGDFELTVVDDVYGELLQRSARGPVIRADALPLVVSTQAKITRFGEGGRRRMFRFLEPELKRHPELHVSPTALFISDATLADAARLRSALTRALGFHFDTRLREAIESMDAPLPDRP